MQQNKVVYSVEDFRALVLLVCFTRSDYCFKEMNVDKNRC